MFANSVTYLQNAESSSEDLKTISGFTYLYIYDMHGKYKKDYTCSL